jgi:hypothetical protein
MNFLNIFNPNQGQGVLSSGYGQQMPQGYMTPLMQAQYMQNNGATGNARGSMRMPQMPNNRIDMNEALIRMGGNIVGASAKGPLAAFQAGTDTYGSIMDANRQADMARYNAEYAQAKGEEDRALRERIAGMRSRNAGNKEAAKNDAAIASARTNLEKIKSAEELFKNDTDSSLTGINWSALISRGWGRVIGNEDEASRLFLNEITLDSVMARVAETKGAISNAEMDLFKSQAPSVNSPGNVWVSWLRRQRLLQEKVLARLESGETIDRNAPLAPELSPDSGGGAANSGGNSGSSAGNSSGKTVDELLNIYDPLQ